MLVIPSYPDEWVSVRWPDGPARRLGGGADPDPFVGGMDPQIQIRIHTKTSGSATLLPTCMYSICPLLPRWVSVRWLDGPGRRLGGGGCARPDRSPPCSPPPRGSAPAPAIRRPCPTCKTKKRRLWMSSLNKAVREAASECRLWLRQWEKARQPCPTCANRAI